MTKAIQKTIIFSLCELKHNVVKNKYIERERKITIETTGVTLSAIPLNELELQIVLGTKDADLFPLSVLQGPSRVIWTVSERVLFLKSKHHMKCKFTELVRLGRQTFSLTAGGKYKLIATFLMVIWHCMSSRA